jgi:hypothetical protein
MVFEFVQATASVTRTEYVVLDVGEAVGFEKVVLLKPVAGVH